MSSTTPHAGSSEQPVSAAVKNLDAKRESPQKIGGQLSGDTKKFLGILLGGLVAGLSVVSYDTGTKTGSENSRDVLTRFMRPMQDSYKELRFGISTKEIDALRSRIADFFDTERDTRKKRSAYNDFMKIGGIVSAAQSIAKKENDTTDATIRYAGGEARARTLAEKAKVSLSCAFDKFLSETSDDESLDIFRKDPTALIGTADMIAAELKIDIADILSNQKKQEILLIGMTRCLEGWDPSKGPFHDSPHFGQFVKNCAMLHGKDGAEPSKIDDVLVRHDFRMDHESEVRVQEEMTTARKVLAAQYPSAMALQNH